MKIATLCGMGFGTSMMLKLTIDDILKEFIADAVPFDDITMIAVSRAPG